MSTNPTITTNAQLAALSQDDIAAKWKAGDIDYAAISAERAAADDATRRRATRIRDGITAGFSPADAVARADA